MSESGQSPLFVGTKKQAQDAIREEATRCGQYFVNARWLGGMMTNFKTMRTRVDRLNQPKTMQTDGTLRHAAQEGSHEAPGRDCQAGEVPGRRIHEEAARRPVHRGIPGKERNAIAEAHKLTAFLVVAIADTNCDPDDRQDPGNDDAIRAIKLISSIMANAVLEGKQGEQTEEAAEAAAELSKQDALSGADA